MIKIYFTIGLVQLLLSIISLVGGVRYLRFFRKVEKTLTEVRPFATLIVPCKGVDLGLEDNLSAMAAQDYSGYEMLFVVEDPDDEAVEVIAEVMRDSQIAARMIFAGRSDCTGQKVHNLMAAAANVSDRSEVLVFADSDARPQDSWLRALVGPLADESVGCTTGYRWFFSGNSHPAAEILSVWNASIASALGPDDARNFCWGGSTALRRETFERLEISKAWRGTVSDDFVMTQCLKNAGLGIRFVPECLTPTFADPDLRELLEFTTRQMKITRVYSSRLWLISLIGALVFFSAFWAGLAGLAFLEGPDFLIASVLLGTIFLTGAAKAWVRLKAVRSVLRGYDRELRRQLVRHIFLWPLSSVLFLVNDIAALFSRKIRWRGIEYELVSAVSTGIVKRYGQ